MQHENKHTIAVTILDARRPADEQPPAGELTVHGQPYDLTDEQALALALDSEHVDLAAGDGRFARAFGTLIPSEHVLAIVATVSAASRPNTPEEQAAVGAAKAAGAFGRAPKAPKE